MNKTWLAMYPLIMKRALPVAFLSAVVLSQFAFAADSKPTTANITRPIPPPAPPAKVLSAKDLQDIESQVDALAKRIDSLRADLSAKPELLAYLPDVMIFEKAVRFPLADHELVDLKDAQAAIAEGMRRADALQAGDTPWESVSGVRGYTSAIDGSVQPYLIELPATLPGKHEPGLRLDVSFHGRNELLTELKFISGKVPQSDGKIVLSLYGRYCNASKFAGEFDALEAIADVERRYPVDKDRLLDIGFSMGGASAWQFATHYTDLFAAASPGAGFAESAQFLDIDHDQAMALPWYERVLWHWYDCTDYAVNLAQLPTIAYAGEIDPQKQSSDIMMAAMAAEGLKLNRLIGPKTRHAYEKATKVELDRELDKILASDRNPVPASLRFTTWTLRYNHMYWVTVDTMERHWLRARVDAQFLEPSDCCATGFTLKTQNVAALTLSFGSGECPVEKGKQPIVQIDGSSITVPAVAADGSWTAHFVKTDKRWATSPEASDAGLHKVHGLQGPIDDAFLSRFVFVRPTGSPMNEKTGAWEAEEFQHATTEWRRQFRGEPPIKDDAQITDEDIASSNLVCFGDPSSNKILARVADKLPIKWTSELITVGKDSFPADHHAPVLIYPNPLNPQRYLVINSGFTFRENDYISNARQTPKLPDYAVVDVSVPPSTSSPGGIATAGFFDEQWQVQPDGGRDVLSATATDPPSAPGSRPTK
jgi:hypothetical protein